MESSKQHIEDLYNDEEGVPWQSHLRGHEEGRCVGARLALMAAADQAYLNNVAREDALAIVEKAYVDARDPDRPEHHPNVVRMGKTLCEHDHAALRSSKVA